MNIEAGECLNPCAAMRAAEFQSCTLQGGRQSIRWWAELRWIINFTVLSNFAFSSFCLCKIILNFFYLKAAVKRPNHCARLRLLSVLRVKGRPQADCPPLKTLFVDTMCDWVVIRDSEFVVVTIETDDVCVASDSCCSPLLVKQIQRVLHFIIAVGVYKVDKNHVPFLGLDFDRITLLWKEILATCSSLS